MICKYIMPSLIVLFTLFMQFCYAQDVAPTLINTAGLYGSLAFSSDSECLALAGSFYSQDTAGVKLYNVSDWHEIDTQKISDKISSVIGNSYDAEALVWPSNSSKLYVALQDNIAVVDFTSLDIIKIWKTPAYSITAMLPTTNKHEMILDNKGLALYNIDSGAKIKQIKQIDLDSNPLFIRKELTVFNDNLVFCAPDAHLVKYNVEIGTIVKSKALPWTILCPAVSVDKTKIAAVLQDQKYNQYIQLFNSSDLSVIGDPIYIDKASTFAIDKIIFDHDDQSIFVLLEMPFTDPKTKEDEYHTEVRKIDLANKKIVKLLSHVIAMPKDIAESGNGRYLACSTDKGIYVWELRK